MSSEEQCIKLQEENDKQKKDLGIKIKKLDKFKKDYMEHENFNQQLTDYSQSQTDNTDKLNQEINNYQTIIEAKEFELKRIQTDYSKLENMSMISGISGFTKKTNVTSSKTLVKKNTRGWFNKNKIELEQIQGERDEQRSELEELLGENDIMREKFDRINSNFVKVSSQQQDSCSEIDDYKSEIVKLKEENSKLEKRYDKANTDRQNAKELLEKLKYELQTVNETLVKVKESEKRTKDESMEKVVDLKAENYIISTKSNQIQKDLEEKQNEVMDANLNIENLKSTVLKRDEEIQEFAISSANYIEEYKKDYNLYNETIKDLRQKLQVSEETMQESSKKMKDSELKFDDELEQNVRFYDSKLDEEKDANHTLKQELLALKEKYSSIDSEYLKIKNSYDEISLKYTEENVVKSELELVLEQTQREASCTLNDLQKQNTEIRSLKTQIQEYKENIESITELNTDNSEKLETQEFIKVDNENLSLRIKELEQQNQDLSNNVSTQKQKDNESLKTSVKIQDDQKSDIESLEAQVSKQKEENLSIIIRQQAQ